MNGDAYEGARLDKDDVVLKTIGLEKAFDGLVATDDVSTEVERGTITGMTGPNGAGKSTLFNPISGSYENDAGHATVNGEDVTDLESHECVRKGFVRIFQTPRRLEGMSVHEAMLVGPDPQKDESIPLLFSSGSNVTEEERANIEQAHELFERFEIGHLIDQPPTDLSDGQMKLVELAWTFTTNPNILLLDEPVAGVNPTPANNIKRFICELNGEGQTFLTIGHDMPIIMDLVDPIIVLDQGKVPMEGPPDEVRPDDRVIEAYLGGASL